MKASYALGLCYIISVSIIWSAASILVQYLYQNLEFDSPFLLTYIGTSLLMILIPIYMIHVRRGIIWECLYKFLTCRQSLSLLFSSNDGSRSILRSRSTNIGGVNSPSALYIRDSSSNDDTRLLSSPSSASSSASVSSLENIQSSPTRKSNNNNNNNNNNNENTIIHNNNNNNDDEINNENVDEEYHLDDTNIFYNDSTNNNISSHLEHFKLAVKVAPFWFISNYFYNVSLQYTTIT